MIDWNRSDRPLSLDDHWSTMSTPRITTQIDDSYETRVASTVVFALLAAVGLLSNGLPLLLSFLTELRHSYVNFMVANLAFADCLECAVFLFGQCLYVMQHEQLSTGGCAALAYVHVLVAVQVFIFPPFLALNRYIGLFYQSVYERVFTRRNIFFVIAMTWTISALAPSVFTVYRSLKFDQDNEHCCIVISAQQSDGMLAYGLLVILPLMLCNLVLIFCNVRIHRMLFHHANSVAQRLEASVLSHHQEMLYFMLVDMLVPVLTHIAYHVAKFTYTQRKSASLRRLFTALLLTNSAGRGVITLFMLAPYKRQFELLMIGGFRRCRNYATLVKRTLTTTTGSVSPV